LARVLIVYRRSPMDRWLSTYAHNLDSLRRFSGHHCFSLNMARQTIPKYLKSVDADLVVFHHTFLSMRIEPEEFARQLRRIDFVRDLRCPKIIVAQDEQVRSDLLSSFVRDFGVSKVFTPASASEWAKIYKGVDFDAVTFHTILTGYVDEPTVRKTAKQAKQHHARSIDVGYRSWGSQPFLGRHGQLKGRIAHVFQERAPEAGLVADISTDYKDAIFGDRWFDFLLDCKYTIGVEGGSSVFDGDGTIAERTREYLKTHFDPPFEEVEAACFPGLDGQFRYFLLSPRHLEAVMTRTCQVLIEGEYGGVLEPGKHYIELKRDFSNLDEVLGLMKDDQLRAGIVERAYEDIVASGRFSYRAFADFVFREALGKLPLSQRARSLLLPSPRLVWNRIDEQAFLLNWRRSDRARMAGNSVRATLRPLLSAILGEERLKRMLLRTRSFKHELFRRPVQ
jgi:hypothetical protein